MKNIERGGTACDVSEMIPTAELEAERLRLAMLHDYEDGHGNSNKGHHTSSQTRTPKAGHDDDDDDDVVFIQGIQ